MIELIFKNGSHSICIGGVEYARILPCEGAVDSFTALEEGVWKWTRRTQQPVDKMRMEVVLLGQPTFTMVPSVSYNGNGWGNYPE